jgi:hypothetical protein
MQIDRSFHTAYRELEEKMKALAEADGDVFLPNPEPPSPVHYVLICMEPSLGWWAQSADHARSRVEAGFRNFLFSIEDFILHFCVRRYLCGPAERYHMTDFSKGAMLVDRAGLARIQRYDRWYALLQEEIDHRCSWQRCFSASNATKFPKTLHSGNPLLQSSGTSAKCRGSRS